MWALRKDTCTYNQKETVKTSRTQNEKRGLEILTYTGKILTSGPEGNEDKKMDGRPGAGIVEKQNIARS